MSRPILDVQELRVSYGRQPVLLGASLQVAQGEVMGLVGESGSGKTTLVQGALRMLGHPAVITGGSVTVAGEDVLSLDASGLRSLWWRSVSLVPQNALNALNPMLTVGDHFSDTLLAHGVVDAGERKARAQAGMALVDLAPETLGAHPHMLSGGMRQRVAIALALLLNPSLVVFDEPTTALDVVVERDILDRIKALQRERGFAALFITHDLSLLRTFADRVAVMYAGEVVEVAPVSAMGGPRSHPYTRGLVAALPPALGEDREAIPIPGAPPMAGQRPSGCGFAPRCAEAEPACQSPQQLAGVGPGHRVACRRVRRAGAGGSV